MDDLLLPALVPVPAAGPVMARQAHSDDDMVDLWLGCFRSATTRAGYATDLRAFRAHTPIALAAVTVRHIQDYAGTLHHLASATQARRLSAVKSLLKMAHRVGYLPFDVGAPVPLPAIKDTLAERILTEWQVQQLLGLERNPRNGAMLRLIYGAGLRISEVCGLLWRDLTPRDDSGQITIFGKGGKTRVVLLPAPLWARLQPIRGRSGPNDPVFASREGGPLDRTQVHRIVKLAARRARLPNNVSAHFLRHSHVSHALDRGAPVHVVRATVGHASLETTSRYSHARPGDSSARYLPG